MLTAGTARRSQLTAARLTPAGRGAVATIRVCGRDAESHRESIRSDSVRDSSSGVNPLRPLDSMFRAANGAPLSEQPLFRVSFGQWGTADVEELVVCRLSATTLEIHCHGGDAAVRRILDDLVVAGCEVATWQELLRFDGVLAAECGEALSRASTWRTTKFLLEQASGVLQSAFERLAASARTGSSEFSSQIDQLLAWADFGIHLSTPWSIVLTGRPNVGKSSLINLLLGYHRAIVFDEPGTTRDVVTGDTAFDGWPVVLSDTAGVRQTSGELESAGIELARQRLATADLVIVLIDVSQAPMSDDEQLLRDYPNSLVIANKSDLQNQWHERIPPQAISVSCATGEGISELQRRIVDRLIPIVPTPGTAIPITERQVRLLQQIKSIENAESRAALIQSLFG